MVHSVDNSCLVKELFYHLMHMQSMCIQRGDWLTLPSEINMIFLLRRYWHQLYRYTGDHHIFQHFLLTSESLPNYILAAFR